MFEEDPELIGTLVLSTLTANSFQFNSTTRATVYGWFVNWASVLGEPEDTTSKFLIEHKFQSHWSYLTAIPSASLNAFQAFSTLTINKVADMQIVVNLCSPFTTTVPSGNTNPPANQSNQNQNAVTNYITYEYANQAFVGNEYQFYFPNAKKTSFRCEYPGDNKFVTISTFPSNSAQGAATPTNNYLTSGDQFSAGVHILTFRRLKEKMRIPRTLEPEVTGQLTLMTNGSNVQQFDAATGTQTYTWYNIQWTDVLGNIANPGDSVWQVKHRWVSNAMPSQSINTVLGFPSSPSPSCPFFPVFFVGCNIQGNNSTPGVYKTINTIYCKFAQEVTQSNWYQFLINTFCDESTFVVRNPENIPAITIVTRPSYNATYTSNTATTTSVVNAYPADYYTNGTHIFTFTLLKRK